MLLLLKGICSTNYRICWLTVLFPWHWISDFFLIYKFRIVWNVVGQAILPLCGPSVCSPDISLCCAETLISCCPICWSLGLVPVLLKFFLFRRLLLTPMSRSLFHMLLSRSFSISCFKLRALMYFWIHFFFFLHKGKDKNLILFCRWMSVAGQFLPAPFVE